jgi:DNA invertase Pin-like site-specific DNA recombinase
MRATAYIRVSSEDQVSGNGIDRQRAYAKEYCKRAGLSLAETLVDDGYSAFKNDHILNGKLGRYLAEVDTGRHRGSALLIEYLDRLSRLGITETFALIGRLRAGGVELHETGTHRVIRSLDDLGTSIVTLVDSYQAQEYSRKLSERIGRGWAAKKANASRGKVVTKNVPAWLAVVDGRIVENEKAAILRDAFRLAGLGIGAKNILRQLNGALADGSKGYSLSWLSRSLCNRAVLGEYQPCHYVNGRRVPVGEPVPNYFPAIITQSEWEAARTEIDRKNRIPADKRHRGGDRHTDRAKNLFTGLLKDVTWQPERGMGFQEVGGIAYLHSAWSPNRKSNRLHYKKFETAFLGFLHDLDWQSVAGQSESDEEKAARAELETVLGELDKTVRRIAAKDKAMEDPELDMATLKVFAAQIAKDQDRLSTLAAEKERLRGILEAARTRCNALHDIVSLRRLIEAGDNETRLRLRTEIRNRIARIDFLFTHRFRIPLITGTAVRIEFVNGAVRRISLKRDGSGGYTLIWPGESEDEDLRLEDRTVERLWRVRSPPPR